MTQKWIADYKNVPQFLKMSNFKRKNTLKTDWGIKLKNKDQNQHIKCGCTRKS